MIVAPHQRGDEDCELTKLHPDDAVVRGVLPGVTPSVHCADGEVGSAGWHAMALDGLHFDFRDRRALITLTGQARFPLSARTHRRGGNGSRCHGIGM